jgi:hypothetical protein
MGWNPVAIPIAERRRQKVLLTRSGRDQLYLQLAPKAGFLPAQDPPGAALWELDLLRRAECQETQYQSQQGPPPCSGKERGRVIGMGHRIAQRRKVRERKTGSLPSVLI